MSAYEKIVATAMSIFQERGETLPTITPETALVSIGLDSLDIASLVVRLESELGQDPFSDPNLTQYPRTFGELARLYSG